MKTLAFVCVGNSFKSIACERIAKELTNDIIILSGGTAPKDVVNLEGAEIMKKKGYSLDGYKPHDIDELPKELDYVVKMGCKIECPMINAKETFDFEMDEYPSKTYEDKEKIVDVLEGKVKELITIILANEYA